MDQALKTALSRPDVDDVLLSAVGHADMAMRRFIWRSLKPGFAKADRELMVGDKTAKDFVNEALRRLCDGTRKYDASRSLLDNLNSVTDSIISSEKKSSDRTHVIDFALQPGESPEAADPLAQKSSNELTPDATLVKDEAAEFQRECFKLLLASFDGDQETQAYLEALSEGFFDIDEISTLTGIPVPKIYEIRRKLKKYAPQFFGVTKFGDLERKLEETKR